MIEIAILIESISERESRKRFSECVLDTTVMIGISKVACKTDSRILIDLHIRIQAKSVTVKLVIRKETFLLRI